MALRKVAPLVAVSPGTLIQAEIAGASYAICNVGGEIRVVDGVCPHQNGPLGHGALHGGTIVCPWHAWEFDSRTGEYDYNPEIRLACHPVTVSGGDIYIDVP